MLKNSFLSEKKLLNAILRAKLQAHEKKIFLYESEQFFAMQKTDFHEFELIFRKSHFRA